MRSSRAAAGLAAVAAALVVAPAGASAAHHLKVALPHKKHARLSPAGCRINEFAEPRALTSGETAQVFGALKCPAGSAGQTVTIFEHSAGVPGGFKAVGTPTTAPDGTYSFVTPALTSNSAFYALSNGAHSATRTVRVAPLVTVGGPPEGANIFTGARSRVTFKGTVSPADAGATVILQREAATANEEWRTISTRGIVAADGTFVIVHRFSRPGDANLRAVVRPHGGFAIRGISNTLSYQIEQAQNPNLTINTSADPVSFGQTFTLSGVLAGGASKKVALLARPKGSITFTQVQETTTDGSGGYTFTIPSATSNTAYRVTGAGISSAVLFEGVKYVLTASASAASAPAGTPVTFSGTVLPGNVGKAVYLERENASGQGFFHVVDVGFVTSGSTWSITHFMFGSGKEVFRIKVPGDPSNQAVRSSTFPVEVTPPPPGVLRPRPPAHEPH